MSWDVELTRQAIKDLELIKRSGLQDQVRRLFSLVQEDPFLNPPRYEKLVGDLSGAFSRRINIKHRMVYAVDQERRVVRILRLWTYFE